MRKLLSFLALLMMMVTSSFAAAPDGIGNITVKYYPAGPVLDIYFVDQEDVVPSWSVDIKLDGKKINCEMGQDWNEIYAYPSEQLAVGKHTIVFPAGSLMLNSTTTYDKECSATFVVADFTATVSQLPTNDYSFVNAEFKLSEIAKAFGTDAATLASALNEGSATFGLFDADGQLIGNTADGPGSYWMKADGSVTSWGPDAAVYNGLINYNASADILVIPVGQYPDAFKGGETWANVFTLKYNGTSKTLGVMLKIIGENEGSASFIDQLVLINGEEAIALNAHSAVSVEKAKAIEVSFDGFVPRQAGYSVNTLKLVAGEESSSWEIDETIAQGALTLSGKGYVEFEEIIPFEAGTRYCVIINADNESATFEINGAYTYPIYGQVELAAFDGNSYYATYSSSRPAFVEFKANVLTVKVDGTKLKLDTSTFFGQDVTEEVEDGYTVKGTWIPANTGVLLKSYTNKVRVWTSANKEIDPINNVNFLRPAAEEMQKGNKFYMLAYGDEALTPQTLGFYYGAEDGAPFEAREGSAYLAVPKNVEAKGFCFADEATAIKNVDAEDGANATYNLQGQRVSGSQKGIVIVNGKKVVK